MIVHATYKHGKKKLLICDYKKKRNLAYPHFQMIMSRGERNGSSSLVSIRINFCPGQGNGF